MRHADESQRSYPHLHVSSSISPDDEAVTNAHANERNGLLHGLPLDDYAWLLSEFTPVHLQPRQVLIEPGEPINHAWFVRHGVASIIAIDASGGSMEVGTIGFEGFVGLPLLLDDDTLPHLVIAALHGEAWRIPAGDFRRVVDERPAIRSTFLRYASRFTAQLAQSVACSRIHTLEERCANWLLMTHERVHHEPFALTHQFLAAMLGVRRAGVSIAMGALRDAGVIDYTRGHVTVLDRARLAAVSCKCHRLAESTLDRVLRFSAHGKAGEERADRAERAGLTPSSDSFQAPRLGLVSSADSISS